MLPPLTSWREKITVAFLTKFPWGSRATAVRILCCVLLPGGLTPKVVGAACSTREATVVATNWIVIWFDGPDNTFATALMTAGPALSAERVTVALPLLSVIAHVVG